MSSLHTPRLNRHLANDPRAIEHAMRDTTYRVSSIEKLVVEIERGLVMALPIRLQRTTCSSANVSTTVTSEMRGTHQLSPQVQHSPVHLLALPLDLLQSF